MPRFQYVELVHVEPTVGTNNWGLPLVAANEWFPIYPDRVDFRRVVIEVPGPSSPAPDILNIPIPIWFEPVFQDKLYSKRLYPSSTTTGFIETPSPPSPIVILILRDGMVFTEYPVSPKTITSISHASITFTGKPVVITANALINVAKVALNFIVNAVTAKGATSLSVTATTLSLSGKSVTPVTAQVVSITKVSLTFTGGANPLIIQKLPVTHGVLSFTPRPITILASWWFVISHAVLILQSHPPTNKGFGELLNWLDKLGVGGPRRLFVRIGRRRM